MSTEEDPEGTEQARDHPIGSTVTFASPQKRMTQARPPGGRDVERPPGTERPRAAPSVPKQPCGIDREPNFPAQPRAVPSNTHRQGRRPLDTMRARAASEGREIRAQPFRHPVRVRVRLFRLPFRDATFQAPRYPFRNSASAFQAPFQGPSLSSQLCRRPLRDSARPAIQAPFEGFSLRDATLSGAL